MSPDKRNTPCKRCGAADRYANGECRACRQQRGKRYYSANVDKIRGTSLDKSRGRRQRAESSNLDKVRALGRRQDRRRNGWAPGEHERAEAALPFVESCVCCASRDPRHKNGWVADHDHVTGRFRAHVCQPCNLTIGFVERHALAMSADVAAYLARHTDLRRMRKALRQSTKTEARHA
jgi:hypothetical protein